MRVTSYTIHLARRVGVPEKDLVQIARGALLHDIGKIGIPDAILRKPGALTQDEWEIIKLTSRSVMTCCSRLNFCGPLCRLSGRTMNDGTEKDIRWASKGKRFRCRQGFLQFAIHMTRSHQTVRTGKERVMRRQAPKSRRTAERSLIRPSSKRSFQFRGRRGFVPDSLRRNGTSKRSRFKISWKQNGRRDLCHEWICPKNPPPHWQRRRWGVFQFRLNKLPKFEIGYSKNNIPKRDKNLLTEPMLLFGKRISIPKG